MFDFMNVTRALADENRVRILMALEDRELCVCQIIDLLALSPSTVSKHLSVLRNARLIRGRKQGRWMHYRLDGDAGRAYVTGAIDWVRASLGDDPVIAEDRQKLEQILSQDIAARCG